MVSQIAVEKEHPMQEVTATDRLEFWEAQDEEALIAGLDPFTYEVVRHRLSQVNEEQGAALRKSTGSVVVDAGDFNVAIATADGDVAFDGDYALFHAAATPAFFRELLDWAPDNVGIHDGDMFFTNDPFIGALHQNDGAVATPIFWEGKLVCWSAAVLHALDVGGTAPGSFCVNARSRWDDPIRIPPVKLVDRGVVRRDIENLYFGMSRMPAHAALDLRAQMAAGHVARARMQVLFQTYGPDVIIAVLKRVLRDSEDELRDRLRKLPDGTWRAVQYVDKAGDGDSGIHKVALAMTKRNDSLSFDLTGSDPQAGIIGAPRNVSKAALAVPVLQYLCAGLSKCSGAVLRVCEFVTEPGTLPDVTEDMSVSCASATGTYTQISVAHQCIASMLASREEFRHLAVAPMYTNPTVLMLSGLDAGQNPFVTMLMDPTTAAIGARTYADGVDSGGVAYLQHGRSPDVEMNELYSPILYTYRREATDSAGAGRFRGGAGLELGFVPHGSTEVDLLTVGFGAAFPDNAGAGGGMPSCAIEFGVHREAGVVAGFADGLLPASPQDTSGYEVVTMKGTDRMSANDLLVMRASASGGWGDPLERDPMAVAEDVRDGIVSRATAERLYGVVLDDAGAVVDATGGCRAAIRAGRAAQPLARDQV
jgi:N-methylhydantoinase B